MSVAENSHRTHTKHKRLTIGEVAESEQTISILMSYYALEQTQSRSLSLLHTANQSNTAAERNYQFRASSFLYITRSLARCPLGELLSSLIIEQRTIKMRQSCRVRLCVCFRFHVNEAYQRWILEQILIRCE